MQSIYDSPKYNLNSLESVEKEQVLLKNSYRTGKKQMEIALSFLDKYPSFEQDIKDSYIDLKNIKTQNVHNSGINFIENGYKEVKELLNLLIFEKSYNPSDILILAPRKIICDGFYQYLSEELQEKFIFSKNIQENHCVLTTYHSAKGIESIHLIISDSFEGIIAGNLISRFLIENLYVKKVDIVKIANLTITKEFDFAKKGLKNLTLKIASLINSYSSSDNVVVSPIGGFKAQIFIVGLIAQLYKVKAYYLYEGSKHLIELLPLPITIDTDILKRNIEIVSEIKRKELLEKSEVDSYLKNDKELKDFLEDEHIDGKNYYSLSVLGLLAFDKLNLELKSSLPKSSGKNPKDKKYIKNSKEPHADQVTESNGFKTFISRILDVDFVEKVIINYYSPDNRGDIIRIKKSSNFTEGRVLVFEYNNSNGTVKGDIYITENSEEDKVDAALLYLSDFIL